MKVFIDEHKDEKSREAARIVLSILVIIVTSLAIFTTIQFLKGIELHKKVIGSKRDVQMVKTEFKMLTDEMRETEQMISNIVDDVATIADKFNRSAEQQQVTPQQPLQAVNMAFIFKNFQKFTFRQTKNPPQAIFQFWFRKHFENKGSIDPEQGKNETMDTGPGFTRV